MIKAEFRRAGSPLILACMACLSAFGAQPASKILHAPGTLGKPWVISIANTSNNFGKVKIFDVEPIYNEDDEIQNEKSKVAELRNYPDDKFTLKGSNKDYWLVFYPKLGLLNLTLNINKSNVDLVSAAKVRVTQVILKAIDKDGGSFTSKGFGFLSKVPGFGSITDLISSASGNAVTMEVKVSETSLSKVSPDNDVFENAKSGYFLTLK